MSRMRRSVRLGGLALALILLAQCRTVGYYGQAVGGGLGVILSRRPVEKLLADPEVSEELKVKLRRVQAIRRFAVDELGLPDNKSYRTYSDLGRRYAVWTVVAAPELSVEPRIWCFPVAGCVSYRGYFRQTAAERYADRLESEGFDVEVGGVTAYSTLGWFADPVLNTFIDLPEADLAGLIFHELSHQVVYAAGDTVFNESFATVVELEGVRRWLAARGREGEADAYREAQRREEAVTRLMLEARGRLAEIYSGPGTEATKRARKTEELALLVRDYRELVEPWGGGSRFDGWFDEGLDNARLAAVGAYFELVPGFEALFASNEASFAAFYEAARTLAAESPEARRAALSEAVTSR